MVLNRRVEECVVEQVARPTFTGKHATMPETFPSASVAWTASAALWVYFMHGGFGFYEAGMCRKKNTVDTLSHNLIILAMTVGIFWATGFGFIYGEGNAFIGLSNFAPTLLPGPDEQFDVLIGKAVPLAVGFAFVMSFSDTSATLIAGTGAERIRFVAVTVLTVFISGLIFPVAAHWVIGEGWLTNLEPSFFDTGSGFIHLCGGACALAVALLLGPRKERFDEGRFPSLRSEDPLQVSSMPLVFLGAFILWMGFFAFNAGFAMVADRLVGLALVNTALGGGLGAVAAMTCAWLLTGKASLRTTIVGLLTGNVAAASPSAVVMPWAAALIGAVAGLAAFFSIRMWAWWGVDDPTEYLTMNLVGGAVGLAGVGLLASPRIIRYYVDPAHLEPGWLYGDPGQFLTQVQGTGAIFVFSLIAALIVGAALRAFGQLRVNVGEEEAGSDVATHGEKAYEEDDEGEESPDEAGTAEQEGRHGAYEDEEDDSESFS